LSEIESGGRGEKEEEEQQIKTMLVVAHHGMTRDG